MIDIKLQLGNAHFEFIKGIEGVSIRRFGLESSDQTYIYITSHIVHNEINKSVVSTLNPTTSDISHNIYTNESI